MADSEINSNDAKSKYQIASTSSSALVAKGVEMVIQSNQQRQAILKEINWEVQKGDIEILMGPSGSGKTTLLLILAGLLTPTAGSVYLLGQEITRMSRTQLARFRRQYIGFIFQDFNLFPALTAIENVEAALNVKGIQGRRAREQAMLVLEQVGLGDKAKQLPRDLSGGQKQRVAIARSLTGDPQLIMADEPTASLDSQSGRLVMELLHRLAKEHGCTVLIVTHDPRILDLANRVTHMEDGVLQQEGRSI